MILGLVFGVFIFLYLVWICKHCSFRNFTQKQSCGEKRCRDWLEQKFARKFDRVRPDWLKNPESGRNLELDCFNEELGLAVEFNGIQHYKYTSIFHKNKAEFLYSLKKDMLKKKLCLENNVHLVVVPYWIRDVERFLEIETTSVTNSFKYSKNEILIDN
jgi:hypothetical protein